MSDRVLGVACVVVAAGMAWAAKDYAAPISYEPVGPRAFPLLLATLMGIGGLWLNFDGLTLQGVSLCGVVAVVLNLILPRVRAGA